MEEILLQDDGKLHLLTGRAGSVLPFLLREIGRRHDRGLPCVLLVPQQYTLEAERTLVRELQLPGLIDITVLSPQRLLYRIREAVGTGGLQPLDERGRCMAIGCALHDEREQLEYYRTAVNQPGLTDKVSALLGDLQHTELPPAALLQASGEKNGAMAKKGRDIARVWAAYEAILGDRFADTNRQMEDAARQLARSGILTGVSLFVYGFDLLQPELCGLLAESLRSARFVGIGLTMDSQAADARIFEGQLQSKA